MATISSYMAKQMLDWMLNEQPPLVNASQQTVADIVEQAAPLIGAKEIAVLGAAAIIKKNPEITRRFSVLDIKGEPK